MKNDQTNSLIIILLLISGLLSFLGALFRLQHYPYGAELLILSIVFWVISVGMIIGIFLQRRKKRENLKPATNLPQEQAKQK